MSHHGKGPGKLGQLKIVAQETIEAVHDLLSSLKGTQEVDSNLVDRTMVFFGSNLTTETLGEFRYPHI